MKLTRTVHIDAPPARVWEVMRDVERWPEWTPSAINVERHDDGELRVGSAATLELRGASPTARWVVTQLEEGRGFWWVSSPRFRPSVAGGHEVAPDGAGSVANAASSFFGAVRRHASVVISSKASQSTSTSSRTPTQPL
jgi:hypothetical protein